ncbi:MAG: DUF2017 family protein [Actinobacteria bacterium]|nr:DUF2017 family protein [Actinomycetota bacterium]
MPRFRTPVRALDDGTYRVELGEPERALVRSTASQLRELLVDTDSPVLRRLFPPPYGDDTERNEGWAVLARPELIEHRLASLDVVVASTDADSLDEDQIGAWMRSLNDVRLVLGTVLEVVDDDTDVDVDEHNAATYQAYELLGYLLEVVVTARASRL